MLPPVAAAHPREVFDQLAQRRLLVVSGKGGVGRTTVSALIGLALAGRGLRVLVATTGLDHRLAWMLGADRLADQPEEVAPRLTIQRLDPHVCMREYGELVLKNTTLARAVFDNRVVRRLMLAVPGLDDFAVLGKVWHEATRGGQYDVVVFDGPATGHLRYLLGVPQAILRAVKHGPLTGEAKSMHQTLTDATRTAAVLVGLPELWPLTELGELALAMRRDIGMSVGAVVVNAVWSASFPRLAVPDADPKGDIGPFLERINQIAEIGRDQQVTMTEWLNSESAAQCGSSPVIEIPWLYGGMNGAEGLRRLLAQVDSTVEGDESDEPTSYPSESA